ncbi:MAG: S24 family peptidase [Clostridia bacterium]
MSDLGNKEIFAKNLKYYMTINNKTRNDVCKDLNFKYTTFTDWYNGNIYPRIDKIEMLANYFRIEKSDLIESRNKSTNNSNSAIVFVYGTIPAGIPMECIEDIIDTEEISQDMLKGGKQYFGLRVKGDSMEPDYLDGDTLILEKADDCENGDDCVVMVNGDDGTFKRVFKNENGIILQPLNPSYAPMPYTNEQIENLPVRIIGIVEEIRRKKRKK